MAGSQATMSARLTWLLTQDAASTRVAAAALDGAPAAAVTEEVSRSVDRAPLAAAVRKAVTATATVATAYGRTRRRSRRSLVVWPDRWTRCRPSAVDGRSSSLTRSKW